MQNLIHRYHDLDAARLHNARFVETVRAGVYAGFKLRVNPGYPDRIDIVKGSAPRSVLVTGEGIIVEETEDLTNVIKVAAADSSLARIDLVVCEYQFTTDTSVPAVYKIIRGKNQSTISDDPVPPEPQNQYQISLGYITVRAQLASGGVAQVRVDQTDIRFVEEADFSTAEDQAALKPIVDFTNTKRIFVYAGIFPNSSQTGIIRYSGGYSEEVDDTGMVDRETKYFLFGISDDGVVSVISSSSDPDTLGGYDTEVLPLAIATVTKTGGTGRIVDITDVRFPFARQLQPQFEQDAYTDLLANSVFQYLRVDTFESSNLIDLDTATGPTGADSLLSVKIDRADTSLTFDWLGTALPDDDVLITTEDLLGGTPITNVTHFMLMFEATSNVTFDYSTVSKYSGFSDQRFSPKTIVNIPAGGGGRLYIRFRVPVDAFSVNTIQKVYSYGCYINLDAETLNKRVIADLGVGNLLSSIPNLIANGNFRWWSRNDKDEVRPDCNNPQRIDYTVSDDPESINTGENIFAADGWQFTRIEYSGDSKLISRVIYSEAAIHAGITDAIDTGILWQGESGDAGARNHLEYRIPVTAEMQGQPVTFSIEYQTSVREAIGIGIAFYTRDEAGVFSLQGSIAEMGAVGLEGTLLVESNTAIAENTYAVGLILILNQVPASESSVFIRRARAALGSYKTLPYTASPLDRDRLRAYYERGRMIASGRYLEGDDVAVSAQFGSVKHIGLSKDVTIVARVVSGTTANRSQNVEAPVITADEYGVLMTGRAISSGIAKIDVEWEAFILYPSVS